MIDESWDHYLWIAWVRIWDSYKSWMIILEWVPWNLLGISRSIGLRLHKMYYVKYRQITKDSLYSPINHINGYWHLSIRLSLNFIADSWSTWSQLVISKKEDQQKLWWMYWSGLVVFCVTYQKQKNVLHQLGNSNLLYLVHHLSIGRMYFIWWQNVTMIVDGI